MKFKERVLKVVSRIPRGKTMSYAEVAKLAGSPKAYRAVGNIMHNNPDPKRVPCHRVIKSDGSIGGYAGGVKKKIALLKKEGVIELNSKNCTFRKQGGKKIWKKKVSKVLLKNKKTDNSQ